MPLDGSDFAARALPVARAIVGRCRGRIDVVTTRWDGDIASIEAAGLRSRSSVLRSNYPAGALADLVDADNVVSSP